MCVLRVEGVPRGIFANIRVLFPHAEYFRGGERRPLTSTRRSNQGPTAIPCRLRRFRPRKAVVGWLLSRRPRIAALAVL